MKLALVAIALWAGSSSTVFADPCSAASLKLGAAKELTVWQPPKGCTAKPGARGERVLKKQADIDAAFVCEKGTALGVDAAKQALVVVHWTMSPAAGGLAVFDDGAKLTVVTKFRPNCPKDPHPMPMEATTWFTIAPGGPERTFGTATCSLERKCP
jgi:hypothetical protein